MTIRTGDPRETRGVVRPARACLAWALPFLALACSGDDENVVTTAGDGFYNASEDSAGAAGNGAEDGSGSNSGSGSGSGGELLDSEACRHVDLIIAVDGSQSMEEELEAMRRDVFPAFAQRLSSLSANIEDFRAATLDACPAPASFHTRGNGGDCHFTSGQPWIDSSSPNMEEEFACVGDIYQDDRQCSGDNDDEQPASTIAASLEEPMASGPNANFRRADALVVVVAITDEDEQPTGDARSPEEVYNRLAEVVADDPRRMVFLGIGGGRDCRGVYGTADDARRLREITNLFQVHDRGVFWDLCEGRLEDGLEEAFRVIDKACNELPPPCAGLDWDCGDNEPPPNPPPLFCDEFPDDPSCRVD